ncbi:MAG: hypothetical protein OSA40_05805 [Phycisphaerales bacterium]|nr:hypothetical protein [Phycisphaerales bacterium]
MSLADKEQNEHRRYSVACFNAAWELMERTDRSSEDDLRMMECCMASIHHWRGREDCSPKNLSIGYWQASRIASLLGQRDGAVRHAATCLDLSRDLGPFLCGYAEEATARAALIDGDVSRARIHLKEATALCAEVTDPQGRGMLDADLIELADRLA